ncbi:MAG: TIGR02206 family membrane protein [Oscillospiraceae bacterium]|jgi:hypothetical integral membrane protein (TIGR02206 family)|nr:TIGR02206 family membrane protein [Oscillospiraceae bacterium]
MRHNFPFFQVDNTSSFEKYDATHMFTLLLIAIAAISIVVFKNRITHKADKIIRGTTTALAIVLEISFYVWAHVCSRKFLASLFSLDLCHITAILALFLNLSSLLGRKIETCKKIFPFLYFWSEGAIAALLFPNIRYGVGSFRFYNFFYIHAYIALTAIYGLVMDNYKINFKSYLRALGTLVGFAPFVWVVNLISGENYMFLAGAADVETPLDGLGEGAIYYLNFFLLTAFCMFLLVFPHELKNLRDKRKLAKIISIAEADWNYYCEE